MRATSHKRALHRCRQCLQVSRHLSPGGHWPAAKTARLMRQIEQGKSMDTVKKSSKPIGKALIALAILVAVAPGLAAANPIASESSAIHERQLESSDGKKWIVRTIPTSDFQGGTVMVEQRLFRDGKGGLVYRFDDQSQATKIYHQALCEAKDSVPQEGQPQSPERQCGVGPAQTAKLMSPLRAMLQSPPGARTICTLSPPKGTIL